MKEQTKSRAYIIALFVVFFAPLLFAMWMFNSSNHSFVIKTQNHGDLIQPPRPLGEFVLTSNKRNAWTHDQVKGKWTLLYLGNETCDLYCEASLFKMRQVRLSLGHDSRRIHRIYLVMTKHDDNVKEKLVFDKYANMQFAFINRSQFYSQLPQFKDQNENKIYLIDPMGNLMMSYSKNATSKGMKSDLKRLLKVSKIG